MTIISSILNWIGNTIGDDVMGTTATTLKGAIAELKAVLDPLPDAVAELDAKVDDNATWKKLGARQLVTTQYRHFLRGRKRHSSPYWFVKEITTPFGLISMSQSWMNYLGHTLPTVVWLTTTAIPTMVMSASDSLQMRAEVSLSNFGRRSADSTKTSTPSGACTTDNTERTEL